MKLAEYMRINDAVVRVVDQTLSIDKGVVIADVIVEPISRVEQAAFDDARRHAEMATERLPASRVMAIRAMRLKPPRSSDGWCDLCGRPEGLS